MLTLALFITVLAGCGNQNNETIETSTTETVENTTVNEAEEQSQLDKALALIDTFASGDTETAKSLLADGYIQHNLEYGTGRDAFVASLEYLASAEEATTVENIRSFEDGE